MKFLLDSCISSYAVKDLRNAGFDVLWIPETGKDPGDNAIIKKAYDESLTDERLNHIKEHPEMVKNIGKINETLAEPDMLIRSKSDEEARLYYRYYMGLSIGDKYLCVVVKSKSADSFVVTAFFTDSIKKGEVIWKK